MYIVEIWSEEAYAERYDPASLMSPAEVAVETKEDLSQLADILLKAGNPFTVSQD